MKQIIFFLMLLVGFNVSAQVEVQITPGQVGAYGAGAGDIMTVSSTPGLGHTDITRASLATALAPLVTVGGDVSGTASNAQIVANAVGSPEIADAAVTMPKIAQAGATSGQVIKWSGTAWTPSVDNVGSVTSGNLTGASTKITITGGTSAILGTGTTLDVVEANLALANIGGQLPLTKIAQTAATTGQVLKWNGTTYAPAADADAQTLTRAATTNTITVLGGGSVTVEDEIIVEQPTVTAGGTTVTVAGPLPTDNQKMVVTRNGQHYVVGASGCGFCNATRAALVFTFSRSFSTGETVSVVYPKQ
jgi:hypothetical protein